MASNQWANVLFWTCFFFWIKSNLIIEIRSLSLHACVRARVGLFNSKFTSAPKTHRIFFFFYLWKHNFLIRCRCCSGWNYQHHCGVCHCYFCFEIVYVAHRFFHLCIQSMMFIKTKNKIQNIVNYESILISQIISCIVSRQIKLSWKCAPGYPIDALIRRNDNENSHNDYRFHLRAHHMVYQSIFMILYTHKESYLCIESV